VSPAIALFHGCFEYIFVTFPNCSLSDCRLSVERVLQNRELVGHSFFSIFLHAGVDGSVDLQTIGVNVIRTSVGFLTVFGYGSYFILQNFPEVRSITGVLIHLAIVELDGLFLQLCGRGGFELSVLHHLVEHHISSVFRLYWISPWVVGVICLKHSNKNRSFFHCKAIGFFGEEGSGSVSDPINIVAEWNGI